MTGATDNAVPWLVAVVVLYRTAAADSATLRTLHAAIDAAPGMAAQIDLVIWDNTPGERARPEGFSGEYWHAPSNPGLAVAYNRALAHAVERGVPWLVTFDDDTHLTVEYLREMLSATRTTSAVAVLPRLMWQGRTLSPFRPRTQGPALPLEDTLTGWTAEYLQGFNSGAGFSVPFLVKIGGFDSMFPLDYLDHSTFARVHRHGGHLYVLHARLEHELSSQTPGVLSPAALQREQNVLSAERHFVRVYGTKEERRMYPIRMIRRALSVLVHRGDAKLAFLIVRTLLEWNP